MASRDQPLVRASVGGAIRHNSQEDLRELTEEELGQFPGAEAAIMARVYERTGCPPEWVGAAAGRLGLRGEGTIDQVRAVYATGKVGETRIRGDEVKNLVHQIILAYPKTFSLLAAGGDEQQRDAVRAAIDVGDRVFIQTLERLLRTRSGKAGVHSEPIDGLMATRWRHHTSSSGDPHEHSHFFVNCSAPTASGKWTALDGHVIFSMRRIAEAAAMQAARDEISHRLGLGPDDWTEKMTGSMRTDELTALEPLIGEFSRAGVHIDKILKRDGRVLGAASNAETMLAWRQHRQETPLAEQIEFKFDAALNSGGADAAGVREHWNARSGGRLFEIAEGMKSRPELTDMPEAGKSVEEKALEWVQNQHRWTVSDVAAFLVPWTASGESALMMAAESIDRWADRGLVHTREKLVPMVRAYLRGERIPSDLVHQNLGASAKFTSQAQLENELCLQAIAEKMAQARKKPLVIDEGVFVAGVGGNPFSQEQSDAIRLMQQGRGLTVMTGVAGAGKTTILKPVADAARQQGMNVVSIARNKDRARETAEGLDEAGGCPHFSVADFLGRKISEVTKHGPTLLVIDEAALIDRLAIEAIFEKAKGQPIQIVMFGDRQQVQSIDRTGGFSVVEGAARQAGATVHLAASYRNKRWSEEAAAIRAGDAKTAVVAACREGRVVHGEKSSIATKAAELIVKNKGEGWTAICPTNVQAAEISQKVQAALGITGNTPIAYNCRAGVGDKVRTRKNIHGKKIMNGQRWTVLETLGEFGLVLEDKKGRRVRVDADYAEQHVELDYAATIDSAQGITLEGRAIVTVRAGQNVQALYSGATRGKLAPVYLVDAADIGAAVKTLGRVMKTDGLALTAREIVEQTKKVGPKAVEEPAPPAPAPTQKPAQGPAEPAGRAVLRPKLGFAGPKNPQPRPAVRPDGGRVANIQPREVWVVGPDNRLKLKTEAGPAPPQAGPADGGPRFGMG